MNATKETESAPGEAIISGLLGFDLLIETALVPKGHHKGLLRSYESAKKKDIVRQLRR